MPNVHETLSALFTDIASAIREKSGTSGTIIADNFPSAIQDIPTGGGGEKPVLPDGIYSYNNATKELNYDLRNAGVFGSIITLKMNNTLLSNINYSAPFSGSIDTNQFYTQSLYENLDYGTQNININYKPNSANQSLFTQPSTSNVGIFFYPGYYVNSSNTAVITLSSVVPSYVSNPWVPSASIAKLVYQGGN